MEQQTIENNFDPMDNLDFTLLTNTVQSSLPTEEINNRVRYDYNTSESFYEIDVGEINMTLYPDHYINDIINEFKSLEQYSNDSPPTMEDINDFISAHPGTFHSTESNDGAEPIQSTDEQLAMIKTNGSTLPVVRSNDEKPPTKPSTDQSILLSKSVAVSVPTPNQLQIVHPLEDTYRARYKSDYFPQTGAVRRPRYVADNDGNHFVTLQMPAKYNRDFRHEFIRVALITTSINDRGYFYSPYKFQTNHDDVRVPDQNPIYIPVHLHQGNDYTMKLHLVLIKSKLDQLSDAQPLKLFSDEMGNIQNLIPEKKLTSKDLINKYQLEKSHLAFTLCTKLPNGSYDVHPETTIISSIITEATKPSLIANNKSEPVANNVGKKICCPNCSHSFDPTGADVKETGNKRKSNAASTKRTNSKSTNASRTAKKKKIAS